MRFFSLLACVLCLSAGGGCTSSRVIENTRVPEITVDETGIITFNGEHLPPDKVVAAVRHAGFVHTQEINILVPDNPDRKLMQTLSAELVRGGYTRTVFLKGRKATATLQKAK
jgi:hypothetical protein